MFKRHAIFPHCFPLNINPNYERVKENCLMIVILSVSEESLERRPFVEPVLIACEGLRVTDSKGF
ncbi:MAG: hypothetical protein D6726_03045 [Nitrospirae bacterium]|nr:MAG: hypothetical protein D6726_03045 [Nitrospirota bacterium]